MNIFYGNNLENLLKEHLLKELKNNPLSNPLKEEIIIVQNQGMTIWLKQLIAKELGISCNFAFPFINGFINEILEKCLTNPPEREYFHPYTMSWKIWNILYDISDKYPDLTNYLNNDHDGLKHYQLASRIANCYDQYQIYRPELILDDFASIDQFQWQKEIWDRLAEGKVNRSEAFQEFLKNDQSQNLSQIQRISIVGIFSMPPVFVDFFHYLSKYIEVNFYISAPLDFKKMNSLLFEVLGNAGDDLFKLFEEKNCSFYPNFVDNKQDTLLSIFQNTMQSIEIQKFNQLNNEKIPTIQFHNCHSRMREVEVLKNNILQIIDKDGIKPSDILVMMPNIADYSPYIKSIFHRKDILSDKNINDIPYSITDNSISFETSVDEIFLKLLDIHKYRFEASLIIDLLEKEIIYKNMGLVETDIEVIRTWISESNIRWGINGKQRKDEFNLIEFEENSWEKGLNRMFIGFCLKDEDYPKLHYSHLPYDNFEGHNNFILGKLSHFITLLENYHKEFQNPVNILEWQKRLMHLINDFFYDRDEFQKDLILLREKISKLVEITDRADVKNEISIEILQQYFKENLQDEFQTRRYFRGGITFSTLQPLRNIPAKVVCIMGMNDNEFPRSEHFNSFNLLSNDRRTGDRIKREEDQYLFMEAILSAQKYLIISYLGQDIRSNEKSEPASPVCEFQDYLIKLFPAETMTKIQFQHKLQSHNLLYFDSSQSKYINYSKLDFPKYLIKDTISNKVKPIQQNEIKIEEIHLEDLIKRLSNSAEFFVEKILGARIKSWDIEIKDAENFNLDTLEQYGINAFIQSQIIKENSPDFIYDILKAEDKLPVGLKGKQDFDNLYKGMKEFLENKIEYLDDKSLLDLLKKSENISIDLNIDGCRIYGKLPPKHDDTLIVNRFAKFKGKDALKTWIYHLVASISQENYQTICFSKEKTLRIFLPISQKEAKKELIKIIEIYKLAHIQPLYFFPNSSLEYLIKKPTKATSKIDAAKAKWTGSDFSIGDSEDPYFSKFFTETHLESEDFSQMARLLLSPFAKNFDELPDYRVEEVKL